MSGRGVNTFGGDGSRGRGIGPQHCFWHSGSGLWAMGMTLGLYWDYIGIMENGNYYLRVWDLGLGLLGLGLHLQAFDDDSSAIHDQLTLPNRTCTVPEPS